MKRAPVAIATASGPVIRGERWGESPNWAILVHAPGEDLDAWGDLPARLATGGYTALAIDLPGHGLSDDPIAPAAAGADSEAIAAALACAAPAGAARLFPIAAGSSCGSTLVALRRERADALIAFSPEPDPGDVDLLRDVTIPKLLIAGTLDPVALAATEACYRQSIGRTTLSTFAVAAQGTALLRSAWSGEIAEQIVLFLREFRV